MPSLADIKRRWLLKTLGINSDTLTEADLTQLLGADPTAPVQSEALMPYKAGQYYAPPHTTQPAVLGVSNQLRGAALVMGRSVSVDALAVDVTVVGTVGSVVRLGIYRDTDDGNIELVADAGTIDGTVVAAATKNFTPVTLDAGKLYWLVGVCQGVPATEPTIRTLNGSPYAFPGSAALVLQNNLSGLQISGVAGALPFSLVKSYTTAPYKIAVKVV